VILSAQEFKLNCPLAMGFFEGLLSPLNGFKVQVELTEMEKWQVPSGKFLTPFKG